MAKKSSKEAKKEMKKEKNNTVPYIIGAIVVVVILVIIFMQMNKPAEIPTEPAAPEVDTTPTEPAAPAPTETPDVAETGEIQYGSRGILSDVKCENGKISGIITNVLDVTVNVLPKSYENDARIMINGVNIQDFSCDKEVLAPGEYTYCEDLAGEIMSKRLSDSNELAVWFLSDNSNRGTLTVTC